MPFACREGCLLGNVCSSVWCLQVKMHRTDSHSAAISSLLLRRPVHPTRHPKSTVSLTSSAGKIYSVTSKARFQFQKIWILLLFARDMKSQLNLFLFTFLSQLTCSTEKSSCQHNFWAAYLQLLEISHSYSRCSPISTKRQNTNEMSAIFGEHWAPRWPIP